jgi:PIN domain nuclease of toxin-antitoxin system
MKYLLDTHTFIWWDDSPTKLSSVVLELLKDKENIIYLSLVSLWEIQIKLQIGKLKFDLSLAEKVSNQQRTNNIQLLPITKEHIFALDDLPLHHRDPFDRLLIAQATIEKVALLSKDSVFEDYDVPLIW